jgi:hypothetical protein
VFGRGFYTARAAPCEPAAVYLLKIYNGVRPRGNNPEPWTGVRFECPKFKLRRKSSAFSRELERAALLV